MKIAAAVLLAVLATSAVAQEALVACILSDEKSQSFCKRDPRAAIACERAYKIDSSSRTVKELNPGRILPEFVVTQWTETSIALVRNLESFDGKLRENIRTRFDRLNGRMIEYSEYVSVQSGEPLSQDELTEFEAARVKQFGLFGYLSRSTISAECKTTKPSF